MGTRIGKFLAVLFVAILAVVLYFALRPSADIDEFQTKLANAKRAFETQNWQQAAEQFEALAAEKADNEELQLDLMVSRLNLKDYIQALAVAETFIGSGHQPSNNFLVVYGNVLKLSGKTDEAIGQYEAVRANVVSHPTATLNLADIYVEQKELVKAKAIIDEAITKYPEEPLLVWMLAHIQAETGDTEAAKASRTKAQKLMEPKSETAVESTEATP